MFKSTARLPHVSFISQFSAADLAIVGLLAIGGFTGFPGFPKFSDIKTQIGALDHKLFWAMVLFLFNYLLIYRKIRKCYFSIWLGVLHAVLCDVAIVAICWGLAKLSFLNTMSALDSLVATQSALAAVLLVVQSWFDFKPDLRSLAKLSKDIGAETQSIENLPAEKLKSADVKRASDLCDKFKRDIEVALLECPPDAADQLSAEKSRVEGIRQALKAPSGDAVLDALRRAKQVK